MMEGCGKGSMLRHVYRCAVVMAAMLTALSAYAEEHDMILVGRVLTALGKTDLMEAKVFTLDGEGNKADSVKVGMRLSTPNGSVEQSVFIFQTTSRDSTYVFDVSCEGYMPQTLVYKVENVGPREFKREMPTVYLERAPHKLGEVTVTASKIKFYNRGDTIVYNADAFQLAEGSMLDALINQLPGVQLDDNGRITVNGEFVESLLLNGRQFFDGNNNLMLQNIGAYTVKNVEVYRGQTAQEKWIGDPNAAKHLTMDVKLKKEYSMGWIANVQAGYGTEDRYLGRLFASWFTPTTQVHLIGNINNLNDSRTPGQSDGWTPELMPSGTRRYHMAGLDYSYATPDFKRTADGSFLYEGDRLDTYTSTNRANFFASGNTYDYTYASGRNSNTRLSTNHSVDRRFDRYSIAVNVGGHYNKSVRRSQSVSASFMEEQADITRQAIEALYDGGSDDRLNAVINRSITRGDGERKEGGFTVWANQLYRIPRSSDMIRLTMSARYDTKKERLWDDYDIVYGNGADPASRTRQRNYTDNSPNHELNLKVTGGYLSRFGDLSLTVLYNYEFLNRDRDSYMYALDRLEDMGVYGTLPAGYLLTLDPGNSYRSSLIDNRHTLQPMLRYSHDLANGDRIISAIGGVAGVMHSHLNYWSDSRFYPVRRSSYVMTVGGSMAQFAYMRQRSGDTTGHTFDVTYEMDTETPDLLHMVDVTNTSDPLNVALGNPDLKNAYVHNGKIKYIVRPANSTIYNAVTLNGVYTANALVRGYYYDMSTGVRYNKTYNVSGNYNLSAQNDFSIQFGSLKQFALSSLTEAANVHSVDMVGTEGVEPTPSKVNTRTLGEQLRLSWQIGKQSIELNGKVTDRHTSSSRSDFRDIDATHYQYGVTGKFVMPAGFSLSTDFTFYTRRGYGVRELDTTDAVWNARLSYMPRGGRWVFNIDGFDLLHRLSNVHYAVTATGRTVTYTNTLPRYILATVQYRFNIQPKKR